VYYYNGDLYLVKIAGGLLSWKSIKALEANSNKSCIAKSSWQNYSYWNQVLTFWLEMVMKMGFRTQTVNIYAHGRNRTLFGSYSIKSNKSSINQIMREALERIWANLTIGMTALTLFGLNFKIY